MGVVGLLWFCLLLVWLCFDLVVCVRVWFGLGFGLWVGGFS